MEGRDVAPMPNNRVNSKEQRPESASNWRRGEQRGFSASVFLLLILLSFFFLFFFLRGGAFYAKGRSGALERSGEGKKDKRTTKHTYYGRLPEPEEVMMSQLRSFPHSPSFF